MVIGALGVPVEAATVIYAMMIVVYSAVGGRDRRVWG